MALSICVVLAVSCEVEDGDYISNRAYVTRPSIPDPILEEQTEVFLSRCGGLFNWTEMREIRYGITRDIENPSRVGYCQEDPDGGRYVVINLRYRDPEEAEDPEWRRSRIWMGRAVLFHELGHCLLDLPHTPGAGHIMSENMASGGYYYEENWVSLLEDMCPSAEVTR